MARKLERLEAKRLFIEEKKEIPEIATGLHIPEPTVYRWKADDKEKGNDWDKDREAVALTSFSAAKSMLAAVVTRMTAMVGEIQKTNKIDATEVYALRQLILSAKALQKEVDNLGNILLAMQEFTDFMGEREPEMLKKLEPFLLEFGNTMSKKYGHKG